MKSLANYIRCILPFQNTDVRQLKQCSVSRNWGALRKRIPGLIDSFNDKLFLRVDIQSFWESHKQQSNDCRSKGNEVRKTALNNFLFYWKFNFLLLYLFFYH